MAATTVSVESVREKAEELVRAARQSVTLAEREYVAKDDGAFWVEPAGRVSLRFNASDNQYSVTYGHNDLYYGPDADMAVLAYGNADNPAWNRLPPAYRLGNQEVPQKIIKVFAVGPDLIACLVAFAANVGSTVDIGTVEIEDPKNPDWSVRFTMNGDSMKAGGCYVPGGVVMTWWK